MTTPRILQVMAGAQRGGAETAFVDMCIALHQAGVPQHIVTRSNDLRVPRLRHAGLSVTTLPFGGAIDIFTPLVIRWLIHRFKPQIVQTWMSRAAAKVPPCPPHARHRYLKICRLGGYYDLKYFTGADFFTTITPDIKNYLINKGIAADRIFHINNFADVDAPKTVFKRADYQTPEGVPLLVTLGRLHHAKAFDTLLLAVADLPGVHLWIGGEGPDRDPLQRLTRDLNISDRVRLIGWVEDRAAFLRAGDICVFPSRYEPFGSVFVQAWAQDIPLVTSNADGPRQYVRDGEDGLIFPTDDVDALRDAITRLIHEPALAQKLKHNGRIRFEQEFRREHCVSAYLKLYTDLLTRAGLNTP